MAVIIVFLVISNIPGSLFAAIRPWLFTTYVNVWQHVMEQPVPWEEIMASVAEPRTRSALDFTWQLGILSSRKTS